MSDPLSDVRARPAMGAPGDPGVERGASHQRQWLLTGAVLILLGLALGVIVRGDRVLPGEVALLQWMHQPPSDMLDHIAWWASRFGDTYTGLTSATLLGALWCAWRRRLDLALFVAVASVLRVVGSPIKWLFDSARPPLNLHAAIEPVTGLGYPSGHTLGAVLVYGAILLAVPQTLQSRPARWIVRMVCLGLMMLIPWSRLRLGVHWPSDVAGGYLFGFGVLVLLWTLYPWAHARLLRHNAISHQAQATSPANAAPRTHTASKAPVILLLQGLVAFRSCPLMRDRRRDEGGQCTPGRHGSQRSVGRRRPDFSSADAQQSIAPSRMHGVSDA